MSSRKVGIIGSGHVGAHTANALISQGIADEIILYDRKKQKMESEKLDLMTAAVYAPHPVEIKSGSLEDLANCDLIINAAGDIDLLKENHDRVIELDYNLQQVRELIPEIMKKGFDGIFINISNPCDIITEEIVKLSCLPRSRVIGTGTGLDTARLKAVIAQKTGLSPASVSACMLGEHGAAIMAPLSMIEFSGIPLSRMKEILPEAGFDEEQISKDVFQMAWNTFEGKLCTEYGIACAAARLAKAIYHDEKAILPASSVLEGEYGETDVAAGVPCIIGKDGIEKILIADLTRPELEKFHSCCESIRKNRDSASEQS